MGQTLTAAFSLSEQIEKYGAYAGLASVVGLAVLSLLYFAQVSEVKRLRDSAGRAPERDAEVEERVAAAAQRRVVAQPKPATPAGGAPAAKPAVPAPPPGAKPAAPPTPAGATSV